MTADASVIRDGNLPTEPSRRDFLKLVTLSTAAIGGAAIAWAFIDSMNPAADVIAAGAPIDVEIGKLTPGQRIDAVLATMTLGRVRHVPVIEGGALKGIVSIGDLVKHRLDEKELEASVLLDLSRMHA